MAIDYPIGTFTVGSLVIIIPLLILGWYLSRDKILAIAQAREGVTGPFPVIPGRQATEALRERGAEGPEHPEV